MALELGRRGAKVIVNYANSTEAAEEVVAQIKKSGSDAASIKANVSNVDEIVRLFDEAVKVFGKLNIVCSNSGVVSFGHVKDVTPEEFDRVFSVNTRGQFFVAREAYKHLEVGGRLIMMGSITGQAKGVPRHAVYSGSKGTIETFVRCMAIGKSSIHSLIHSSTHPPPRNRLPREGGKKTKTKKQSPLHFPSIFSIFTLLFSVSFPRHWTHPPCPSILGRHPSGDPSKKHLD